MTGFSLQKTVRVLLFLFGLFAGLVYAKPFLVPFAFGGLFAMLLLPVSVRLERKGIGRGWAALLCVLLLVAIAAGIIGLLFWQLADLAQNADQIEKSVMQKIEQIRQYISTTFGISEQKQDQIVQKAQSSSGGQAQSMVTGLLSGIGGFLTDTILVLVYIFLLMYYRTRLKNFVIKISSRDNEAEAIKTVSDARLVAQKYCSGMAMMIGSLWVLYGIGFSIIGVKSAILFAVLCGLLEIVPFVGNLVGNLLTVFVTVAQGGDMNMVIGILVTYALVQFIQTYILEPLVVGAEVSLNPLFTIIGIVVGELVWGIAGMVLAIPILGIAKIICDHVNALKPYGYLIGEDKKESDSSLMQTVKGWFKKGSKSKEKS